MVAFNSDQTKVVGTNHGRGTWYWDQPAFFQIQFWAPYFSPPASNLGLPWSKVADYEARHPRIPPSTVSAFISARDFQHFSVTFHQLWLKAIAPPDRLRNVPADEQNALYRQVLDFLFNVVGPQWSHNETLSYVLPWRFEGQEQSERESIDYFRVPVSAASVRNLYADSKLSRRTVMLPSRHLVMTTMDAIESLPGLSAAVTRRIQHIRGMLGNNGQQYSIVSHLEAKQTAAEQIEQPESLIQTFLLQTEPPQSIATAENASDGDSDVPFPSDVDATSGDDLRNDSDDSE
ncbi:hypothetical protein HIM_08406 [Hirsutella minnesotensis 3608]|uniref:Uncharacterized protein n=1 Tax=Hirsutella minnesotensis 3608 TaxID=1043627 RepID=A0A0F7ZH73_9HYPO|nr:hypothetical protein HIM_08406 [Hirsutella minnesotensis 3608]